MGINELKPEDLRRECDPEQFGFETTAEISGSTEVIAQERAVAAIKFGVGIKDFGYNLYVAGVPGTGKTSTVKAFVSQEAKKEKVPSDWCYVNNFKNPDRPRALELPAGRGRQLESDVRELIATLSDLIPRVFESEDYAQRKEEVVKRYRVVRDHRVSDLERKAAARGFILQSTPMGLMAVPASNGAPMTEEEIQKLSDEKKREIAKYQEELQGEMEQITRSMRGLEKEVREELRKMDREVAFFTVGHLIEDLKEKYRDCPGVPEYLEEVREDVINNIDDFKKLEEKHPMMPMPPLPPATSLDRYQVNVLIDNSETEGAPVVLEPNPSFNNLFGRLEKRAQFGTLFTNFTMMKPGALHRANAGYLILNAIDVLKSFFSWDGLKRAIKNREIPIEDVSEQYGFITTQSLRPEPIPLKTKVILLGSPFLYRLLYAWDEDFKKVFKVKADFDTVMQRTPEHLNQFAAFVKARCQEDNLKEFHKSGVAKVVDYASYLVEDKERLSARFSDIADIIREANFWATQEEAPCVNGSHVEKAVEEKRYRSNLLEEKIRELLARGDLLVDVAGAVEGQVNGLAYHHLGDFSFGRPVRITVTTSMGRGGVVDIDRESKLSGNIHTKGVMILKGYLAKKFAQDKPLAISASICFEQSYEEVEGDSASSTELYALLSSLSGCPLKQGIAVTGSVNQAGEIQPIGGVNQKIEGFFETCKAKGLTGEQGVMIPQQNVKNLMLKKEIVEAVREGKFHIHPVSAIDEGIEILTGVLAGKRKEDGKFEENTVNFKVEARLRELAEGLKKFAEPEEKKS